MCCEVAKSNLILKSGTYLRRTYVSQDSIALFVPIFFTSRISHSGDKEPFPVIRVCHSRQAAFAVEGKPLLLTSFSFVDVGRWSAKRDEHSDAICSCTANFTWRSCGGASAVLAIWAR